MEKDIKKLISDREEFLKRLETHLHEQSYSSSKCRMEVDLHRKMYKLGQEKSVTPTVLFESLEFGIEAAICGISSAKKEEKSRVQKSIHARLRKLP